MNILLQKVAFGTADYVDPGMMQHFEAPYLDLHCIYLHICRTQGTDGLAFF